MAMHAQTLLHRYSFVSDASDSVGGSQWNGTVVAPNGGYAATINNGLMLAGGGGPGYSGYVTLPAGILTNTANITVECWASQSSQQGWAELWNFNNGTGQYFGYIPYPANNNNNMSLAIKNNNEYDALSGVQFGVGTQQYIAATFNTNTLVGSLYENGGLIASVTVPNTSYIPGKIGSPGGTVNNYLGQDPWPDPQFQGTIYEFRIWNGVVSQRYLSASTVAGPTVLITNLTPTSVAINASSTVTLSGSEQADVTCELAQTGTTNLEASNDATNWVSSNPSAVTVTSSGIISGVGIGSATVSATVGGVTGHVTVSVVPMALVHRYSFASDASDSVGGAQWNGTVVPANGGTNAVINNGLMLSGGGGPGYSGYVTLPAGVLTNSSSITIETWATQNNGNLWAQLWNFGNGQSQNMGLIPFPNRDNGNLEWGISPNSDEQDCISSIHFPTNVPQYVAVVFNSSSLVGSLYDNASLMATHTYPNRTYIPGSMGGAAGTANNVIGQDPYPDPQFQGTISEMRIWNGAVSPVYLAASAVAGPSVVVTNLTPQTLSVTVSPNMVGAGTQQAAVTGSFLQVSGVTLTAEVTNWVSSNPSVLSVNSSGLITANNGGTATVTATVNGVSATSQSITVASTPPVFTSKPSNVTAVAGDTVALSAGALGGNLNYQWAAGATPIPNATNATLTLSDISVAQSGMYTVTVSNNLGSTNASVEVTVYQSILQHRYSFVADASDSVGGPQWNGTVVAPNGGTAATINGGLTLNGGGGPGYSGYVSLPAGILTNTTSLTIECWVTQNSPQTWAEVWNFNNGQGQYVGFIPDPANNNNNMSAAFRNGTEYDAFSGDQFPSGTEEYVAQTFNVATLTGALYTNGVEIASVVVPNSSYIPANINPANNYLGQDPFPDPQFQGTIYEFRIWDGVVSPLYMAISALAGPSVVVTNLTPTAVLVSVTNATMITGQSQPATVTANFQDATGVPVSGIATNWTSSSPSVLTVNQSGLVTAVGAGSATISATVNGVTGPSATITVPTSAPVLTQQPEPAVNLVAGATLSTSVAGVGDGPFVYYWFYNSGSTPIFVATNNGSLSLPDVQAGASGNYTCIVSNQYGATPSTALSLTVVPPTPYEQILLDLDAMAFWPLAETNGTTAYDEIGGYNGTYNGNINLLQTGPANTFFGTNSYAAQFDGLTTYVDIPGAPFDITNGLTAVTWVTLNADNGFDGLFGHGDTSWRLSINGSGQAGANDGAPPTDATAPIGFKTDGSWHMVAYTYNANTNAQNSGALYVDGALVANNWVFVPPAGNAYDLWIGGAPDYGTVSGTARLVAANIADAAVFKYPLSAAQIAGLYNGQYVVNGEGVDLSVTGTNVVLTWSVGALQQATTLTGPWTNVTGATTPSSSPLTLPLSAGNKFFRVLLNP